MAPGLAAVGTYALLLAWSEHLYQYMLLSSARNWTVAVGLEQFWDSDEAPWNYMMALAIVYALPPIASAVARMSGAKCGVPAFRAARSSGLRSEGYEFSP